MANDFAKRFKELTERAEAIVAAKTVSRGDDGGGGFSGVYIDQHELIKWQVNARHLLSMVSGRDSEHIQAFDSNQKSQFVGDTNHAILLRQQAVFFAAKNDYEGGYLTRLRDLIQAEVFVSELEQARELFRATYIVAAAVIAGTVLETTLRQMCRDRGIEPGSLDKMNADLTKAGAYNSLVQKRITASAAVRNSAAHGKPNEFTKDDVSSMIEHIEHFLLT
jgi:Domain of unknown function (DUF4145)